MNTPPWNIFRSTGAQKAGVCMIQSVFSNCSIEEVSEAAPDTLKWMNVYIFKPLKITEDVVKAAEKAGCKAIVLTVDSPCIQYKRVLQRGAPDVVRILSIQRMRNIPGKYEDPSWLEEHKLSWSVIGWLKSMTELPVVIKGILTGEDAELAVQHGASAIIVSNHGGRQLDTVPASVSHLLITRILSHALIPGKIKFLTAAGTRTHDL